MKKEIISCIYQIINSKNSKSYIGSTKNFHKRKARHIRDLKANNHHCTPCIILGVKYDSIQDAVRALNLPHSTIKYRLKSKSIKFVDWII